MSAYVSDRQAQSFPDAHAMLRGLEKLMGSEHRRDTDASTYAAIIRDLLRVLGAPTVALPPSGQDYPRNITHPDSRVQAALSRLTYYTANLIELGLVQSPAPKGDKR